jgi:DNA-binding IscR family transcriptional regulator
MLYDLAQANLVLKGEGGGWALAKDMSEVSLVDLYRIGSCSFPQLQQMDSIADPCEREFWKVMGQVDGELSRTMSMPMSKLFAADS